MPLPAIAQQEMNRLAKLFRMSRSWVQGTQQWKRKFGCPMIGRKMTGRPSRWYADEERDQGL